MSRDELGRELAKLDPESPDSEHLGTLDYRPKNASQPGPVPNRRAGAVALGVSVGLGLPFLIAIFPPWRLTDAKFTQLWAGCLAALVALGIVVKRSTGTEGFITGLVIGSCITGGLWGLLVAMCGSHH